MTVFFFLSGYLITTLLRREFDSAGRVHFDKFYLRRSLRILPPMYVVLALASLVALVGPMRMPLERLPVLSQFFYFANVQMIRAGEVGMPPGTGQLWSLAVEEHFYLVYPALFALLARRRNLKLGALTLTGLCVAALAWRCYLVYGEHVTPVRTDWATNTRLDLILSGCILGMYRNPVLDDNPVGGRLRWPLLIVSLGILLATLLVRSYYFRETVRDTLQRVALLPLFSLAVAHPRWGPFRWLGHKWVRRLGVLSYSLYLVHALVLHVLERAAPSAGLLGRLTVLQTGVIPL